MERRRGQPGADAVLVRYTPQLLDEYGLCRGGSGNDREADRKGMGTMICTYHWMGIRMGAWERLGQG